MKRPLKVLLAYGIWWLFALSGLIAITLVAWPLVVAAVLIGIVFWATITISDFNYQKKNAKYRKFNNTGRGEEK